MKNDQYLAIVRGIYEAFGKGDIPAILERVSEDVTWEYGHTGHGVPWLLPRKGRAGALEFFGSVAEYLQIESFAPKTFAVAETGEGRSVVIVLVDIQAVVKTTGRRYTETDEVHLWHFDPQGRVDKFRHVVDSAQHVAAYAS